MVRLQNSTSLRFNAECVLNELSDDIEPVSGKNLVVENKNAAFEDIRLFFFGEKLLAFYNYLPYRETGGWLIKYVVGYGEVDPETGIIKNQVSLRPLSKRYDEKNWSPYICNEELFMLTDLDPFLRVIKIESTSGETDLRQIYESQNKTNGWEFGELMGYPLSG